MNGMLTGTKMLAAVLYGKEHVQLESVPVPLVSPDDLLVRVRAALTCGTDIKVFQRGYHARMIMPPALFGHELAGDIEALSLSEARQSFSLGFDAEPGAALLRRTHPDVRH